MFVDDHKRRGAPSTSVETLDVALARTVRRTSHMRQAFYLVVLLVALAGQVSGAVEALGIPLIAAVPAVGALELGGIVVLANADVRRRLGERAIGSRILSAAIAAGAVSFNWLAHADHLLGGFFAGMSALGYLVWLTHTENQRRDRLRATGALPPTTPAYEPFGHWLRHPWLTRRAKSLAKANPELSLYGSLDAARLQVRRERQQKAIATVLHRKIRSAVDPVTADIAVAVYDLDEIATRLADGADYDGLTALIAADLAPERLAPDAVALIRRTRSDAPAATADPTVPALPAEEETPTQALPTQALPTERALPIAEAEPARATAAAKSGPSAALTEETDQFRLLAAVRRELATSAGVADRPVSGAPTKTRATASGGASGRARSGAADAEQATPARRGRATGTAAARVPATERQPSAERGTDPGPAAGRRDRTLRARVHAVLDEYGPRNGTADNAELVELVADRLRLDDTDRLIVTPYVQTWQQNDATRPSVPQQAGPGTRR